MKVLFVSSGNIKDGLSPIIKNQGESLISQGVHVEFFTIKGTGLWPYLRHIFILKKFIKANKFDIIHSHYSFSSYVAALAGARPLTVSLMGSDVLSNRYEKLLILFFHSLFWEQIIVKSMDMYRTLGIKKAEIIPNGVDMDRFIPLDKKNCQSMLNWEKEKSHILFAANPDRKEKNFSLTQLANVLLQNDYEIVTHVLKDISHKDIPFYINAADVLILSSMHEGSPNVIKEAMACNCPIVATDVGDIKWVMGNTEGCFLTSFEPADVAGKLEKALGFGHKTKGRERIIELGLDSETVAKKIIAVYHKILEK